MTTKMLTADNAGINEAALLLKTGEVVAIPTETVYGLAANALDEAAVSKIFIAKGRPQDNPLIVHISDIGMLDELCTDIPDIAYKVAEHFWPGPLTLVLKKKSIIPSVTSGGLDTVGIRMPADITAREIISKADIPLAAPSANLSGSPSPTSANRVFADMEGRIPAIVDGGESGVGVESTVIAFEGDTIRILRPGFVCKEDLLDIAENVVIDDGVLKMLDADAVVRSPGMKYKHYSPSADIFIIDSDEKAFENYINKIDEENVCAVIFGNENINTNKSVIKMGTESVEMAHNLFEILRKIDDEKFKKAYFRCPSRDGVGLAVYNRLLRAAAFRLIRL